MGGRADPAAGILGGQQAQEGPVGQVQDPLQGGDRPQGLRVTRAPGALLPVTEARDTHLDALGGEPVLHPVQGQTARGEGSAQGEVEGAAAQQLAEFRRVLGRSHGDSFVNVHTGRRGDRGGGSGRPGDTAATVHTAAPPFT